MYQTRVCPYFRTVVCLAIAVWATFVACDTGHSQNPDVQPTREALLQRAIAYLRAEGQAADGSFSSYAGPAPTALIATGLLRNGMATDDPMVKKALAYVEQFVQDNGGIYNPQGHYGNYETSLAVMCFVEANHDGRYDALIRGADQYLRRMQWDETEGKSVDDAFYGGAGYGSHERPDMSNTTFFVEALRQAGAGPDDPAIQKALIFISRCQNLETEHNTTEFAAKVNDGGFYYTIAAGGESKAGDTPEGGLRSYASMTYAGLKSMIYAGLDDNDPRVKAATEWIRRHYTLAENPGMDAAGLYYYYMVFVRTMDALKLQQFETADGTRHDWKSEMLRELASRQQANGAWINTGNTRWLEGDPNLVTGYVLLVLAHAK